jgi:hypothetical protein
VLASLALCGAEASSASAISIGIMSGGTAWQEASQWDVMQHSGATIYRMMIRPSFSQAQYDNAFQLAAERNITILPYLYGFKGSEQYPYTLATGPAGNEWETWVYQEVERYGSHGYFWQEHPGLVEKTVPGWEVWNEPNLKSNSPGETVDASKYAEFLKRTSQAIISAQNVMTPGSGTQVYFGGLASSYGQKVSTFLSQAKSGIPTLGTYFNGLSLHPYSFREGVYGASGVEGLVDEARTALNAIGNTKSLWITEIGWNTSNDPNEPVNKQNWVSPENQSLYLTQSFNWIKSVAESKNIPAVIWFDYRDHPNNLKNWADYDGLRDASGAFKQAWYAFQEQTKAPAWPVYEWHSDNLGGENLQGDPDISSGGYGDLNIFARTSKDGLESKFFYGGWSGWYPIAGPALASSPSSVSWDTELNRIDVVGQAKPVGEASYSTITHWGWGGGYEWPYDNLGGQTTSDPDVSSWGYGRLDAFAQGRYGELSHEWFSGTWSGPEWEPLGGEMVGGPGAVSWGPYRIDVFVRGTDNAIWHKWFDANPGGGGWSGWESLGGNMTSDPDASSFESGRLDVFARGEHGELMHKWFPTYGGGWSGWESLGGELAAGSGPSAVSWGPRRIDVVARVKENVPAGIKENSIEHWAYDIILPP